MALPFPFPVPFPFPFEVPELRLPEFLRPLTLIAVAQARVAETIKTWLDGRHTQIFGPLEQAVAAIVIIGLAMQTPPDFWSGSIDPQTSNNSNTAGHMADNGTATRQVDPLQAASLPNLTSLPALWQYLRSVVERYLPSPMTLALIGMVLNLLVMLIPGHLKSRLKTSWDLFWPPWQDRSASVPNTTESERAQTAKLRETEAGDTTSRNEEEARLKMREEEREREKEKTKEKEKEMVKLKEMETAKAKAKAKAVEGSKDGTKRSGADMGEKRELTEEEKEKMKLRAKQEARMKDAEKARGSGEGLTEEEKEKIRMRQKMKEKEKMKSVGSEKMKVEAEAQGKSKVTDGLTDEQKEKLKARQREKMQAAAADGHEKAKSIDNEERLTEEQKAMLKAKEKEKAKRAAMKGKALESAPKLPEDSLKRSAGGTEPLTRSERARMAKRGEKIPLLNTVASEKTKGKARMDDETPSKPTASSASTPSAPPKSAMKQPHSAGESTPPSARSAASGGSATSGSEEDPLMAGDYRPLKSALKKSKKKPRQKKNIHHNYFMTMRGYQPHLIPFPHGFHPKPHHPRNTLWWDNIPKNADHVMAPPPVPKKPEEGDEEEEKVVKTTVVEESSESEAGEGGSKSRSDKKTTITEERVPLSREEKDAGKAKEEEKKKDEGRKEMTDEEKAKARAKAKAIAARGGEGMSSLIPDKARSGETAGTPHSTSSKARETGGETDKDKEKERERAKAKMKAQAEAAAKAKEAAKVKEKEKEKEREREKEKEKERAKAKAAMAAAASESKRVTQPPSSPEVIQIDPKLKKANFVAQGMLCCLVYMINEQLAMLLMSFFAYTYIQSQSPPSLTATATTSPAPRSNPTSSSDSTHQSRSDPLRRRSKADIPAEMKAKLAEAQMAKEARTTEVPKLQGTSEPAKPRSKSDDLDREKIQSSAKGISKSRRPVEGASKPRSLDDLTPEQRARYEHALAAKRDKEGKHLPQASGITEG